MLRKDRVWLRKHFEKIWQRSDDPAGGHRADEHADAVDGLKNALEAKDGERAFRAAHTLKGVCINLGFDRLYNVSAELTEKLRGREIEESEELFEQVEKEYYALTAVLKQYESEL